jgi:hypothetical protein
MNPLTRDALARELFPTAAAFAFAAMVLGESEPAAATKPVAQVKPEPAGRANIIALASQQAA